MVDSLVSIVVEKLNAIQDEVALLVGVTNEIEKISSAFTLIQAVVKDAETRRLKDRAVKIWLENVKDVAYDVDDILDEWMTDALRSQANDEGDGSCFSNKKVRSFLSPVTCFSHVMFRHKIGSKVKEARGRLDDIVKERNLLGLIVYSEVRRDEISERETVSVFDRQSIFGREDDKKKILDLLLQEVNEVPAVISIVGMGGLGKTVLAQLAYHDEKVQGHFEMRMWVHVSDDFDVKVITESIIKSAKTGFNGEKLNLDQLQLCLRDMLNAKRFLLVLDDVWNEDSEKWVRLSLPFQVGALGSRIMITTRSEKFAFAMGRAHIHRPAVLSDDDCWSSFYCQALAHRSAEERAELEDIARQIVKRCGGLPFSAKIIGSAMSLKRTRREWELVLRSDLWNSCDVLGGILPALLLSYYELPPALKQCFTYCSVFPKDWWLETDTIVKLWVAQGFIGSDRSSDRSRDVEEIGQLYFHDLFSRSLLQDAEVDSGGNILRCKMHNFVHDLAQSIAGSECSTVGFRWHPSQIRHSSLFVSDASIYKAHKLRTLLIKPGIPMGQHFHHLRRLRALHLSRSSIDKLPQTVGQLKHLRYLDLSETWIKELPEEVSNCVNLQTLRLNGCYWLEKLPREMRKMIRLRHLELEGASLRYLPQGVGRLIELRTLTDFTMGDVNAEN